jgi:glucose/arabinose dehydrogenase
VRRATWRNGCIGVTALLSVGLFLGCEGGGPPPGGVTRAGPPEGVALPGCAAPPVLTEVIEVAAGLDTPWGLAWTPDGRIFVTERPGRIRVVNPETGATRAWAHPGVDAADELGLMGIALDPGFASNGLLYVVGRFPTPSELRTPSILRPLVRRFRAAFVSGDVGAPHELRVLRWKDEGGAGRLDGTVLRGIRARSLHGGGALAFDSRGGLLLSVGDALDPWAAQDDASPLGKLLRIAEPRSGEGGRPVLPDVRVASGVRNSQGIGVHPSTGTVFFVDHGPSGLADEDRRTGSDELNVLEPGANYGWPRVAGAVEESGVEAPLVDWSPAIAPAGLEVTDHPDDPRIAVAWVTALRGQALHRIELERIPETGSWGARCEDVYLEATHGRLRSVLAAPGGDLWVGTSNRDGRGRVRGGDDRLLHLRFATEAP